MTVTRRRLLALIEEWGENHADWCCTRGCSAPDGRHFDEGAVRAFLDDIGRGVLPDPVPTHPCTGECSCDVGLYVTSLRAAMEAERCP